MKTIPCSLVQDVIDHLGRPRALFSQAYKRRLIKERLRQLALVFCAALVVHGFYGMAISLLEAL